MKLVEQKKIKYINSGCLSQQKYLLRGQEMLTVGQWLLAVGC